MKFDLYKQVIDEISGYAYDVNLCHRGESLLHPDIFKMIVYGNHKGLKTRLHTNATLLGEDESRRLLESELDLLSFSFDGYTKEPYEQIRVNADFDKTLNNIMRFLHLKKELKRKKPYTIMQVIEVPGFQTTDPNTKDGFRGKFNSLPLDEFYVKAAHNWGGRIPLGEEKPNFIPGRPCTFPWYSLTVFWDGKVVPCPQDCFGELELGNVKKYPIRQIWNNRRMVDLRKKMIAQEYTDLKPCNGCDRLLRKTILGSMIPRDNLMTFISENVFGYSSKKYFGKSSQTTFE